MQSTSLDRLKQANDKKTELAFKAQQHQENLDSSKSLENVLFQSFQALVAVLADNGDKGKAIGMVIDALDRLGKESGDNKTQLETIKAGLTELETQLKAVPVDSLKQIPKFLQQRDVIKVTNLSELDKGFELVEKAIKNMELSVEAPQVHVEAPNVNVPAPIVNVPEVNLMPLQTAMSEVLTAIKDSKIELEEGAVKTRQVNTFIDEKFDEWKAVYDTFDDENTDPLMVAIKYYLKGKIVATVKYTYDKNGNVVSGKKV